MTEDPDATRIHLAAHDPAFPALREAAFAAMAGVLDRVLLPQGFQRKGQGWAKAGPAGRAVVHLGRDRFGWEATVTLRWCATGAEEDEEAPLATLAAPPLRLVYADADALLADLEARLAGPGLAWLDARLPG
jgi:hypothetical protein